MNLDGLKQRTNGTSNTISSQKFLSLGTNLQSTEEKPFQQSTINQIKMAPPFGSEQNSNSHAQIPQIHTERESNGDYEELRICNEIIDQLKKECANLELTVVSQKTEITGLKNRIRSLQPSQSGSGLLEKRENESLINRLKEEIRQTSHEAETAKYQVKQSSTVIQNLQEQLRQSKQKLVYVEETQRNQIITGELQQQLQELEDLRYENNQLTKRYNEQSEELKQKEIELEKQEIKSKELLFQAHEDAQECIKYFKGLAFSENKMSIVSQRDGQDYSADKRQRSLKKPVPGRVHHFPASLAPVRQQLSSTGRHNMDHNQNKERIGRDPRQENMQVRSRSRSNSRTGTHRVRTSSPDLTTSQLKYPDFLNFRPPQCLSTLGDEISNTKTRRTHHTTDLNVEKKPENFYSPLLMSKVCKLEFTLNQIGQTFKELADTKRGILQYATNYKDQYCEQIQKFSVLAYDYLEKIDKVSKREKRIEQEVQNQQASVDQLRAICNQQNVHIKAQNALILEQRTHLNKVIDAEDKHIKRKDKERDKVQKLFKDELPLLAKTLDQSTSAISFMLKGKQDDTTELEEVKHLHNMTKTKIKILEEELEKALQKVQSREETINSERSKMERLADLIKEIWQQEVQSHIHGTTQHGGNVVGHNSNRDCTVGFDKEVTIQTTNSLVPEIPMPVNWLADIADHIKQLKEMNDFQTDEVFQIVNILHSGKAEVQENQNQYCDNYLDTSNESGISVNRPESASDCQDIEEMSEEHRETGLSGRNKRAGEHMQDDCQSYDGEQQNITIDNGGQKSMDRKEMSFSNRLAERLVDSQGQTTLNQTQKRKTWQSRPLSSSQTRKNGTRFEQRNHSRISSTLQSRAVATQRLDQQRRVLSGGRNQPIYNQGVLSAGQREMQNYNNPNIINQMNQQLDYFSQSNTANVDTFKRNELYAMLREEAQIVLRQSQVSRETIINMKQEVKQHKKTIKHMQQEYDRLMEETEGFIEQTKLLEQDLKEQEFQNEELQGVIDERNQAMENHKAQIEEFEKELLSLQDQMTHIMKLNEEISAASEHWEQAYNQLKVQSAAEKEQLGIDHKKQLDEKYEKIVQYKRKLREKEEKLKDVTSKYNEEVMVRKAREKITQEMQSKECNTDPAMELLEKHNSALENQLKNVKKDVGAVVDQYEAEQLKNSETINNLNQQREMNKSLVADLEEAQTEINCNREQLDQAQNEIKHLGDLMQQDQEYYREQITNAEGINDQLQTQVEQVTLLAEDLQQQITESNQNKEELIQKAEAQEIQMRTLQQQIVYYQRQINKKQVQNQQQQRESRSHSCFRKNDANGIDNQTQLMSHSRNDSVNNSNSKYNPFNNEPENMQTCSSIFDENVVDESTIRQVDRQKPNLQDAYRNFQNNSQSKKPPRKVNRKNPARKSVSPSAQFDQSRTSNNAFKRDQQDSQVNIEVSPPNRNGKSVSMMGASARTACSYCQNSTSVNRPQKESHAMLKPESHYQVGTEMDEMESYRQLKKNSEMLLFAKKKVKRVIKMVDILIKSTLQDAKEKSKQNSASNKRDCSYSQERSVLDSATKSLWSPDMSIDSASMSESAILEAKAYFSKRMPGVLAGLKKLIENYNPIRIPEHQLSTFTQATKPERLQFGHISQKDPPTIVSSRMEQQQQDQLYVDTEISETTGSICMNIKGLVTERQEQVAIDLLCPSILEQQDF